MATINHLSYYSKGEMKRNCNRADYNAKQELALRQKASFFAQELGQALRSSQSCINMAVIMVQRFYMQHSFKMNAFQEVVAAAILLAGKKEDMFRGLDVIIEKVIEICKTKGEPIQILNRNDYEAYMDMILYYESLLLEVLDYETDLELPHALMASFFASIKDDSKVEMMRKAFVWGSRVIHLTTLCLEYEPSLIAGACIFIACNKTNYNIAAAFDGKRPWYKLVDDSLTESRIKQVALEFNSIQVVTSNLEEKPDVNTLHDVKNGSTDNSCTASKTKSTSKSVSSQSRGKRPLAKTDEPFGNSIFDRSRYSEKRGRYER